MTDVTHGLEVIHLSGKPKKCPIAVSGSSSPLQTLVYVV